MLGTLKRRYAGRRVLVVGSGHSALNVLLDLAQLGDAEPETRIVWAIRRPAIGQLLGAARHDQLEQRGKLGARVRTLLDQGRLELLTGFHIDRLTITAEPLHEIGFGVNIFLVAHAEEQMDVAAHSHKQRREHD